MSTKQIRKTLRLLSQAYYKIGKFQQCIERCDQLLTQDNSDNYSRMLRAHSLRKLGMNTEAISEYKAVVKRESNVAAFIWLGLLLADNKNSLNEAIEFMKQGIQASPHSVKLQNNLGWALKQKGDYEAALQQYLHALSLVKTLPSSEQLKVQAIVMCNIGQAYVLTGRSKEALSWIQKAIHLLPTESFFRFQFAEALVSFGKIEQARKQLVMASSLPETDLWDLNVAKLSTIQKDSSKIDEVLETFPRTYKTE